MPDYGGPEYESNRNWPEKVYRGYYGFTAQLKLWDTCRKKRRRAVFPDCRRLV